MSGGSALSGSIEDFYETCGILLVVGYGLTECSPMICHRRTDSNLIAGGCVGMPVTNTEGMSLFEIIYAFMFDSSLISIFLFVCLFVCLFVYLYNFALTEVMVVDIDADIGETERKALEHGKTGLVLARGPQVMKGRVLLSCFSWHFLRSKLVLTFDPHIFTYTTLQLLQ